MPHLARSSRLLVEDLDGELLVYDQDADTAHVLRPDVARVWQCCDGRVSAEQIALDLSLDPAAVAQALAELDDCRLLVGRSVTDEKFSRRYAVKKLAKTGAAAASVPLIYSLAISPAAAMASPVACSMVPCGGDGATDTIARVAATLVCTLNSQCGPLSLCLGGTFAGGHLTGGHCSSL